MAGVSSDVAVHDSRWLRLGSTSLFMVVDANVSGLPRRAISSVKAEKLAMKVV